MAATCPHHPKRKPDTRYIPPVGWCYVCAALNCQWAAPAPAPVPSQLKLPGLDRGKQSRRIVIREADLQKAVVGHLRERGYVVMEIGKGRKRVTCVRCGHNDYPTGWQGNSDDAPDLFIRWPRWPFWCWIGIELKGTGTLIQKGQQDLHDDGHTLICHSEDEVLAAIAATDSALTKTEALP